MTPPRVAVDCFVRASAFGEPVDTTVETLRDYEGAGVIDELAVRFWPDEVPLSGETEVSDAGARYRLLQAWADRHGVDLGPAFTRRERTSLVGEGADAVLDLPVVCLAIHVDGKLASVVPHSTETTTYTVEEALADIEAHELSPGTQT